ncbi:MAG: hypothetical protein PWQ12_1848 [Clostridiales bacterium]|jgi:hypothetical protein|nr:hypothetical protein [Clostridiales bacterium]
MEQTVIFAVTLVVLVAIVTGLMGFAVPLYAQLRFDHICREYHLMAEAQNGLTDSDALELTTALESIGVESVAIEVPEADLSKRGTIQSLHVEGVYFYVMPVGLFIREKKAFPLFYEGPFLSRSVVN